MKLWCMLLYLIGNVASIYILENRFILDKSKPLSIQCFTNKSSANIEFRLDLIETCNVLSISVLNDGRFLMFVNKSLIPNFFQLKSVNTFDQTLCGTYICIDLDTRLQDSVSVSFKDFDNDTFNIYEGDEAVFITTSCSFGAILSEMKSSWFIDDFNISSTTPINFRNLGFYKTDNCVNATCDGSRAQRFTFGLNFTNQDINFTNASVRVEIVHPLFPLRPLTWRSSKKYPVRESNKEDDKDLSGLSTRSIVALVCSVIFLCVVCVLARVYWKRPIPKARVYLQRRKLNARYYSKRRKPNSTLLQETYSTALTQDTPMDRVIATKSSENAVSETDTDILVQSKEIYRSFDIRPKGPNNSRLMRKQNMKNINMHTGSKGPKERDNKKRTRRVQRRIPHSIKQYKKYSNIQQGKCVWIFNFDRTTTTTNVDLQKFLNNKNEDLFFQCNLEFTNQYHIIGDNTDKTCKDVIQDELTAKDNTDCFICIISSCGNSRHIYYGGQPDRKKESIATLAGIDNDLENINTNLKDKPKILIFDLYKPNHQSKNSSSSDLFTIHKDWLLVFVRNEPGAYFMDILRSEINEMHDKLDFVSILERVKGRNVNMKIIHRMPRKFFLSDGIDSMETKNMSHYAINGGVRCCFFGTRTFDKQVELEGIDVDRGLVFEICKEFDYSSYPLHSAKETKQDFKDELEKMGSGCRMFVFSSHGTYDGVLTKNNKTVKFSDLLDIVDENKSEVPVVLVFDCCREKDAGMENTVGVATKRLKMSNVIVVYAAVEGHNSCIDETTGSYFIGTMCKVIKEHRLKSDFLTLMECVNRRIGQLHPKDQTCAEIDSQLSKKLFLFETRQEKNPTSFSTGKRRRRVNRPGRNIRSIPLNNQHKFVL